MQQSSVWFNRALSSISFSIEAIRLAEMPNEQIRVITSHSRKDFPARLVSDVFEQEPLSLDDHSCVPYCLDFVKRHQVDILIPTYWADTLADHRDEFSALGCNLLSVADPATLKIIKNKVALYQTIGPGVVPIFEYEIAGDAGAFRIACEKLLEKYEIICFKPTTGLGGRGFCVIARDGRELRSPWDGLVFSTTVDEAVSSLSMPETFKEQMLMPYLKGQERSIDCLADGGRLAAAIVRVKSYDGADELIEANPQLVEYARNLTSRLKLSGLYNVQFMESDGSHYFLEINSRLAGGVHYGSVSGVCLPYWAIRLANGTARLEDVPVPKTGIRVDRKTRLVIPS